MPCEQPVCAVLPPQVTGDRTQLGPAWGFQNGSGAPGTLLQHVTAERRADCHFPRPGPGGAERGRGRTCSPSGRGTGRATFRLSVTFLFISLLLSPQWQVRRIYWNCITETCGSQNPQAPRSASCTGRCRAETRTVPPSLERGLRYGPTCVLKGPRLLCWEWSAGPKSGSRGQEESSRGSLDRAGVEGVRSGCIPNAFQTRS